MKALLIDTLARDYAFLASENIEVWKPSPIEDSFSESEFSFDSYCHKFIIEAKIKEANPSVLIIPYSITENILEFTGLQLAHHIRLTESLGDGRFVPIVFVGSESPYTVSRLTPFANILYCEGSYWSSPKRNSIEKIISADRYLEGLQQLNYEDFLKRIDIRAPSNYESHHGVDNEFCLLNWSKYIGCDQVVSMLSDSVGSNLYFKFVRGENPFEAEIDSNRFLINASGSVFVIDDEGGKGWYVFYRKLLQVEDLDVDYLDIPFKDLNREEIVSKALDGIKSTNADVVLLDLRLCDEDFDPKGQEDELTGLQILREIKKWNRGIQVLITTASNKSWNYEKAMKLGSSGYILKDYTYPASLSISAIRELVESRIKRAVWLKSVSQKLDEILTSVKDCKILDEQFEHRTEAILDVAYQLLDGHFEEAKLLNYSYLQLFLLIEEYVGLETIFESGDECFVITENERFMVLKRAQNGVGYDSAIKFGNGHYSVSTDKYNHRVDTNFKVSAIMLFRYGLSTSGEMNWTKVYKVRNTKAAHPSSGVVSKHEYDRLLGFLDFLFISGVENPIDISYAFEEPSFEEKLAQLQQMHQRH